MEISPALINEPFPFPPCMDNVIHTSLKTERISGVLRMYTKPLTQWRLALGWDLNPGGIEIFNHCLGHGKKIELAALRYLSLFTAYLLSLCPLPLPQSNSSAGSSQPLIPDMPTYVGRASLCTNLNFSWEQVSLVWESNRLFSTSPFYIWVYTPPVSCTLALTHISYLWLWDAASFQSCPLSMCPYNYSVMFDLE